MRYGQLSTQPGQLQGVAAHLGADARRDLSGLFVDVTSTDSGHLGPSQITGSAPFQGVETGLPSGDAGSQLNMPVGSGEVGSLGSEVIGGDGVGLPGRAVLGFQGEQFSGGRGRLCHGLG